MSAQASTALEWIRPPRQARSQATLDRLLDAAEDLLNEKGWDDTGVAEIARRAGSSVGSFYARFQDKQGLLNALHERFIQEAYATTDNSLDPERWRGASISAVTSELVGFLLRLYSERPGLFRAVLQHTVSDPDFQVRSIHLNRHIFEKFRELVLERRRELLHPAPVAAAEFALRMITSVLQQRALFTPVFEATTQFNEKQLAEELTCAALGYLGVFPESIEA